MPCAIRATSTEAPLAEIDNRSGAHPRPPSSSDLVCCDRCDAAVPASSTIVTVRGSTICTDCQPQAYWQCDGCDGWNRDGDVCGNRCGEHDGCDCDDCDTDDACDLIQDWSYKPLPVFHGTGPLFLGPEIEIETPYGANLECAEMAVSHLGGLGYIKSDGSLDHGFEIVTHPMSYPWAMAHFPWRMLTQLDGAGCATPTNTGIHVHLSRAGFSSTCHTYRWMKFIYRNQRQVTTLARRTSDEWAAFTDHDRQAVKDYAKGAAGNRYRAINTNNPDTIELRIFASSLQPRQVQAALGFADASVEYTRQLAVPAIVKGGWSWPRFTDWLRASDAYRPLLRELEALRCVC